MHIYVDTAFLSKLLTPTPKVFVGGKELGESLKVLISSPLSTAVEVWLVINGCTADRLELRPSHCNISPVDDSSSHSFVCVVQPPAATSLLAAPSPEAEVVLKRLLDWWCAHGAGEPPRLLTSQSANARQLGGLATAVVEEILLATREEAQQAVREQVSLAAQLSDLRLEYEEARVAMHAMEQQLVAQRTRPQLYWCLPPTGRSYTLREPMMLTQRLPISSVGLAGFDLHSCRPDAKLQDVLLVSLEACDVSERLGTWRLPASVLGRGWVRCWLPRALVALHNELVVHVTWGGGSVHAPSLSLADPGDWPELVAVDNQGGHLEGAIAIAVWSTVPGLAVAPSPYYLAPLTDHTLEYTLSQTETATLRVISPHVEMAHLQFLHPAGFQLHPLWNQAAAAILPGACIAGVDRVTTAITINSDRCQTSVSFALLVTRDEQAGYELLTGPDSDPRILAFSGWQELMPDCQPHPLVLELSEPLSAPAHLVFGTRTPCDAAVDYAWAQWLEVHLRLRDNHVP